MKQREKTGGKRFQKWIEKGDLPNRGGYSYTYTIRCITRLELLAQYTQGSMMEAIGGSRRLLKQSNTIPLNDMPDGTCRTLKANYFKTGRINFQYHNVWGTTGAAVVYETD